MLCAGTGNLAAKYCKVMFSVDTVKQNEYNSKVLMEDALIGILILLRKLYKGSAGAVKGEEMLVHLRGRRAG